MLPQVVARFQRVDLLPRILSKATRVKDGADLHEPWHMRIASDEKTHFGAYNLSEATRPTSIR